MPDLTARCLCGDTYAEHYVAFDGETTGCSGDGTGDNGQPEPCSCSGFEEWKPATIEGRSGEVGGYFAFDTPSGRIRVPLWL